MSWVLPAEILLKNLKNRHQLSKENEKLPDQFTDIETQTIEADYVGAITFKIGGAFMIVRKVHVKGTNSYTDFTVSYKIAHGRSPDVNDEMYDDFKVTFDRPDYINKKQLEPISPRQTI